MIEIIYPTELHKNATGVIKDFFLQQRRADTILLVNSLARGKATPDSDIDIAILVREGSNKNDLNRLESISQDFLRSDPTLRQYTGSNKFAEIHLDIIDGVFEPGIWEQGGGVDFFEVEIGNRLTYSLPLAGAGEYFQKLKSKWLPYYGTELQTQRLESAKEACLYDLEHIPVFVNRGLYFQAFDRLYIAFQKFLQALFIRHKTYPIAYNKWIKDQVVDILRLPELYQELPKVISVNNIESLEIIEKTALLKRLLEEYCG